MAWQPLDDAIGSVPPSTVDVDAVIARQRRAALVRRIAAPAAVTAAAVVALTVSIAIAVPTGPGGLSPGAPPQSSSPTASSPPTGSSPPPSATAQVPPSGSTCDPAPPSPGPVSEDPAATAVRLNEALNAAVRAQLPNAQLSPNPVARYNGQSYGPLEFFHVYEEGGDHGDGGCAAHQDYYLARASITDEAGTGNLLSAVGLADDPTAQPAPCNSPTVVNPEQEFCEQRTGPAGELISIMTLRLEGGPTMNRVDVTKPDGTSVTVLSENVAGDGKEGGPADREVPPLTHDQLVTIALTPTLTLFP